VNVTPRRQRVPPPVIANEPTPGTTTWTDDGAQAFWSW
jgi:hypothetical protein